MKKLCLLLVCAFVACSAMAQESEREPEGVFNLIEIEENLLNFVSPDMLIGEDKEAPAQRVSGGWGDSTGGPTMYQTGYLYYASKTFIPSYTYPGANVTYISGNWGTSPYNQGIVAYLQVLTPSGSSIGYLGPLGQSFSGTVGATIPSTYRWRYVFLYPDSTPELLQPPVNITSCTLNVTWSN